MKRKKWVRLDNASNIFLAARTETDTKVFRLSAEMAHSVDVSLLQQALDSTYEKYVLYHSVLRRGLFWYYLEESDLHPLVIPETQPPCAQIYHYDRRELLFRVLYRGTRIHLEVFHALSDGTGGMWFFQDLLMEYVRRLDVQSAQDALPSEEQLESQLEDSYDRYFKHKKRNNFAEEAASALDAMQDDTSEQEKRSHTLSEDGWKSIEKGNVYRVRGEKTADLRTHVVELRMPVDAVLSLARQEGVSLTVYLSALFVKAVHQTAPRSEQGKAIQLSLPVNLRRFFPSHSARNFFTALYLSYPFAHPEEDTLATICASLQKEMKAKVNQPSLQKRLEKLISYEFNPLMRAAPRPLKDLILKGINWVNNRHITIAVSNLGKVSIPAAMDAHISALYFHVSAVRPQLSIVSFKDQLTATFTSPFVETEIERVFARSLTEQGIPVTIASNKVRTEDIEGDVE